MYRMATTSLFVAIVNATVIPSAMAQQDSPSLWRHNGSIVYLVTSGPKREFYYQEPREGLIQAGAHRNSLLFSGTVQGTNYFGTALIYNPRCGTFTYRVSGPILDNYRRVVLRGEAPRVGPDCKVVGHFTDTLEFVLQDSPSTESSTSEILKPFTGVWTDSPGICKSNLDEQTGASVTTIEGNEITDWFVYSWPDKENQPYDSCGVMRAHALSADSVVVDLDCDHPGHSQKGISLTMQGTDRLLYRSRVLHRCQ
jgi:hypothetical protein